MWTERADFHTGSQRLSNAQSDVASGWQMFDKVFSPGGGVVYGTSKSNGDLLWYRDISGDDNEVAWAGSFGKLIGVGWHDRDTVAAPDACSRVPERGPTRPQVPVQRLARAAVTEVNGKLQVLYVDSAGKLVQGQEQVDGSITYAAVGTSTDYTGEVSALPGKDGTPH
jgi:hypothetical protein